MNREIEPSDKRPLAIIMICAIIVFIAAIWAMVQDEITGLRIVGLAVMFVWVASAVGLTYAWMEFKEDQENNEDPHHFI